MFSGNVYIYENGTDISKAKKSNNLAILTINHPNSIVFSVNGNQTNYSIESSTLTDGGRYLKYILINNRNENMLTFMRFISKGRLIIMFNWMPSENTMGFIIAHPTEDDKRILGINDNF